MILEKDVNKLRESTKRKLKQIVWNYKMMFPHEFNLVIEQIAVNRKQQADEFATLKETVFVERALIEVPETLSSMFDIRLAEDEKIEFRSKVGIRWFANSFPMFKLAEKI